MRRIFIAHANLIADMQYTIDHEPHAGMDHMMVYLGWNVVSFGLAISLSRQYSAQG